MPKILLRIAIVLVLGPFVTMAKAKVMIHVDLDAQQMTVTRNNGEIHVWKVSSGREGFETPTGLFSVQRLDADHFSDEYDQSPMPYSIFFYHAWPSTAQIKAVSDAPRHMVASAWRFRIELGIKASPGSVTTSLTSNSRALTTTKQTFSVAIDKSGGFFGMGPLAQLKLQGDRY